jgi:WD40 repeat protein
MILGKDSRALFSTSKDTTFKVSAMADGTVRRNLSCNLALSCCDVSMDEKYVFIGSWDNCFYMYSVEYGRVVDQVTAHDDRLTGIKVFDDRVLTASSDGSVKLWHYSATGITRAPLWAFMDCEEAVVALDVNLDGTLAVAGTQKGFLYLLDLRTNELIRRLPASPEHHAEISGLSCCGSMSSIACITSENELSLFTVERLRIAALEVKSDGQIRYCGPTSPLESLLSTDHASIPL